MNHLEVWALERASENGGNMARWLLWLDRVQKVMGITSLDGDDVEDGYSLDTASNFFDLGISPQVAGEVFLLRMEQVAARRVR